MVNRSKGRQSLFIRLCKDTKKVVTCKENAGKKQLKDEKVYIGILSFDDRCDFVLENIQAKGLEISGFFCIFAR